LVVFLGFNLRLEIDQINLSLRQLRLSHRPAGASTIAEWVDSLRTGGLLRVNSNSLNSFLEQRVVDWWPTPDVYSFPPVYSMETATCQPYVTSRIEEILKCDGQVHQKKKLRFPGTSNYLQSTKRVLFQSQPYDGHAVVSFSTRKPDIVCYCGERRGGSAITVIGDVKGCGPRSKDFPEDQVGQILDMGTDLMNKQQFSRTILYCFLTDGYRFQFFKCIRNQHGENISFEQSHVYGGETGWQVRFNIDLVELPNFSVIQFE
jgi:hypothetical protein